ncbi:MAG: TonB-dependent receptor [Blastocatellia bacterium]|nr:TonB-dependent receptor [Blastocatellia bacterium]
MKKIIAYHLSTLILVGIWVGIWALRADAQSLGNAGTVGGTVVDQNKAAIPNATVTLANPVSGYNRAVVTDSAGAFRFNNVPPNNYQLTVSATGFGPAQQSVTVRSLVPINLQIPLSVVGVTSTVEVESSATLVENVPSTHTDVDQSLIAKLPLNTPGSGLSDVVILTSPGVAADSNGFFHPLGDHAQASIALDNQPISDQQSKAFSTQMPVNALQSMEVITGAVPAEYGDKTSLVINAITRSGLGLIKPTGDLSTQYGSFGTSVTQGSLGFGDKSLGNFTAFNFERSGRFLDPPEFQVLHDRGTSTSIFDRLDFSPGPKDTLHLNLFLGRNRFQIPNQFDQEAIGQNQEQMIRTVNIAPGLVHVFSPSTLLSVNPYYRLDQVWFYPSSDPFSDQTQTVSQQRRLTNAGIRADLAYNKGVNNAKVGIQVSHTFLTEAFQFGITDPAFNDPASDGFLPALSAYDLTRGGSLFLFNGHTDVKQEAIYAQDLISLHNLTLSLGARFDNYNGITHSNLLQPRAGVSYWIKPSNTVLRFSYSRSFETPYNENLILSSSTGAGGLATNGILGDASDDPLRPGKRNQFNVGIQQGLGRRLVLDADYFWKYTHNAYDFNVILNTPITFPISWDQSKIDGVGIRLNFSEWNGLTAYFIAGHTRARFFPPETGGLFFNSDLPAGVFRIDHDQAFQQTTYAQYQFKQMRMHPYLSFSWRYDSGLVAGSVPDFATGLTLTPDQQAQIGLFCGSTFATHTQGLTDCSDPNRGALRVRIPADGTADDDHNPPRITPRHLFDLSAGSDNLFRTEGMHMTLRFTVINLTNKETLYNFLSTFSGTHFVTPRAYQARLGIVF